jgi:dihydrofolate reductase
MAKIVISTNLSLDGVVQDPDGTEGFRQGGWFRRFGGPDLEPWGKVMLGDALAAEALLLGRRTDEWFASRWNERTGEWADRLNGLPKYVVSTTADQVRWGSGPGTILGGDVVEEVAKLKGQVDGEILVFGSYQLARTLLDHDLVDELRLTVFPVVLGDGERLFADADHLTALRLSDTMTIGDGLTYVTYDVVRDA